MKFLAARIPVLLVLFLFALLFLKNYGHAGTGAPMVTPAVSVESNPRGVAINPVTNIAVIANEKAGSVSIVDLSSQAVLSTIAVGRAPRGVAIDAGLNRAIVGNSGDNTLSVIDLGTYLVLKTVTVGREPEGIAIDQAGHKAVVTNHKDDAVSVIELTTYNVIATVPVGKEPIDAAIDPELGVALVVNEKDYNVSVVDINTYHVTGVIQAGQKPRAIDINPETHVAAVAEEKDNAITVIDLKTWTSKEIAIGKHPIDVVVNPLDNRALVICDEDRTLVVIDLNTDTIARIYSLNKLPKGVAVNSFTNIAGIVDDHTDSLTLIQLPNPVPEIAAITPDRAKRGAGEITVNIHGSRFITSSVAYLDGRPVDTTFSDNHHITATIPKTILSTAGIFPMAVVNPSPDGGTSNNFNFTVNNPVPSITTLEPQEALTGTAVNLDIYGTGFFEDTEVYFGGMKRSTSQASNSKLLLDLGTEDLKTPGKYDVMAYNFPPGGGYSNKASFTVKNPLEVKITSPSDGETINKAKVIVKGTFKSDTRDVGITVYGMIAEMKGNEWIANNVPLTIGANTITATIKDSSGNSANASITANTTSLTQMVALSANITSGLAPLTTYFSITTEMPNPVAGYQLDFEGDGVVDYSGETFEDISHIYTVEGVFYPTVTVTDNQGNAYSDTIAITVLNKAEIDALLKSKWEAMREALNNKDIGGALGYFVERSKERYRSVFDALKDQLPSIITTFIEFNISDVYENIAEYEIVANENGVLYSYPGVFLRGAGGLWKFKDF